MAKPKRGATNLCGVIAVDKPGGMTSHDVVDCLRRLTGEGRIGHAGTLDPAATGLLLVCIGPATRLSAELTGCDKTYEARIVFGTATDTDDAEGSPIATAPLPATLADADFARKVLASFVGEQEQLPPRFSAIKKGGRKAYELARAGKAVELEPRPVTIHALRLIEATADYWDIEAEVSKGTYLRSLARDLGIAVGSQAHLGALRRTRSGRVSLEQAHTLGELGKKDLRSCFLDPIGDLGLAKELLSGGSTQAADTRGDTRGTVSFVSFDTKETVPLVSGGAAGGAVPSAPSPRCAQVISPSSEIDLGEFVCAIGVFDGLHEGHHFVISQALEQARELDIPAVVITFDRDPDELFLKPGAQRKLLINEDRIGLLASSGVDVVLVIPFDAALASEGPLEFLNAVVAARGIPRGIHVGADFRFGARALGTVDDLRLWAAERDCEIRAHRLFSDEGLPVTSTRIRNALQTGELALANRLLARPYFLWARVAEGRNVGRELGFPTANLELEERLVRPADGVYAGAVVVGGGRYRAAISVGVPATFEGASATIEAHLLDFQGDLYGQRIKAFFLKYLREMRPFASIEELQKTVQANIEQTRRIPLPDDKVCWPAFT
jgi:riboflavin kinase/FMN adenylyltransferase